METEITLKAIEVMKAYLKGKQIQYRLKGAPDFSNWEDINSEPIWNFFNCEYRVKSEPRSFWVNEYQNPEGSLSLGKSYYFSKEQAYSYHSSKPFSRCVQFVEVMEEPDVKVDP